MEQYWSRGKMSNGFYAFAYVTDDYATNKKIAEFYAACIKKFAQKEILYEDFTHPRDIAKSRKVISKAEAVSNTQKLFGRHKCITLDNQVNKDGTPTGMHVLHHDMATNDLNGYSQIQMGYEMGSWPTAEEEDEFWEFLCFFSEHFETIAFTAGFGNPSGMDRFIKGIREKDAHSLARWGAPILFLGKKLVTKECLKELVKLNVIRTKSYDTGALLQLSHLSDKQSNVYEKKVGGYTKMIEHHEQLIKEIEEVIKGKFVGK